MRLMFVLGMMMVIAGGPAIAQETPRTITVTGQGQIDVAPDMAMISLGVTHEARVAKDAMAATSAGVAAILARLSELGIESRDMQTSGLTLNPVWDNRSYENNRRPRITGFVSSNQVRVRVRDLDTLGGILDAVVSDGANDFNGLQFGLQNPDPVQDEARVQAVKNARAKAQLYAEAAGVTLGALLTLSEHGGRTEPVMMEMAGAARSADVPIAAGEVGMRASVSMVFAISD